LNLRPLGYEKREAGFRCLAQSLEVGFTWVNMMRLVSDEASRLSVQTPFREVSCTDSCTRQSSRAVVPTATAQVGLWPVICGDARGLDRRLRCIPRMSRAAQDWAERFDYQAGKSLALVVYDWRILWPRSMGLIVGQ